MKIKVPTQAASKARIESILNSDSSKSKKMIALFELGLGIKEIAEFVGVRYNFAYNVISNHVTVNAVEIVKNEKGDSKKDQILRLHAEGKSMKEIAIELRTNYNYVFNTIKAHKQAAQEAQ